MADVPWREVADLFADLVEMDHSDRLVALERRTAERPSTRDAVQRLLMAHDSASEAFLSQLDVDFAQELLEEAAREPVSAGPYRLVRRIGSGGMGHVYEARRDDGQFDQRVAVKVLKRGMDTDLIYRRFLRERQILADFAHPSIARLMDGGVTDDGRPYIVMEYIDGVPIDRYCDRQSLSVEGRIELMGMVCAAVAHAHRNLVVHRDLKPSNILVTDAGRPKLLDFGIAKILREPEAGTTVTSAFRLLTPEYAAPEQALGLPVTTATDVYGLGAVLLELITGTRPPETVPLGLSGDPAALLASATPPQPARVYDRVGPDRQEEIASARDTDPSRLKKRLEGDLGTILTKALEPDPERRYASVDALHDDLVRLGQQRPIQARPLTIGYRVAQFLRRHRMAASATAAAVALMGAFALTAVSQSLRIRAQAVDLAAERDRAQREASTAAEVVDFMLGVFQVADPLSATTGDSITARTLLDRGADRISTDLGASPQVQARLQGAMARAYRNLGLFQTAERMAMASIDATRAMPAPGGQLSEDLRLLGQIRTELGDLDGADAALEEALTHRPAGGDDLSTLATLAALSHTSMLRGDHAEASERAQELAARLTPVLENPESTSRAVLWEILPILQYAGDADATASAYATLVRLEEAAGGPLSMPVATALRHQAEAEQLRDNLGVADSLYRRAVEIRRAVSPNDPATGQVLAGYASLSRAQGDATKADTLYVAAIDVLRTNLDAPHAWIASAEFGLGRSLMDQGRFDEAVPHLLEAQANFSGSEDPGPGAVAPVAGIRAGEALFKAGRLEEAEPVTRQSVEAFRAAYGDEYLLTANARALLGQILVARRKGAEALSALEAAEGVLAARWGGEDFRVDGVRVEMAHALILLGRETEAAAVLNPALARLQADRPDHPYAVRAREASQALFSH